MIGLCADDHTVPMPIFVEPSMMGSLFCVDYTTFSRWDDLE